MLEIFCTFKWYTFSQCYGHQWKGNSCIKILKILKVVYIEPVYLKNRNEFCQTVKNSKVSTP